MENILIEVVAWNTLYLLSTEVSFWSYENHIYLRCVQITENGFNKPSFQQQKPQTQRNMSTSRRPAGRTSLYDTGDATGK